MDTIGEIGRRLKDIADLSRTYPWLHRAQALRQNVTQMLSFFAVLLGTAGCSRSVRSARSSRSRFPSRATAARREGRHRACGLGGAGVRPDLDPPADLPRRRGALRHRRRARSRRCLFAPLALSGSALRSCSPRCSTTRVRPVLIACAIAAVLGIAEAFFGELSRYSLFGVMSGETYFRDGGVPWLGLLASAAVSAAMLFAASRNLARQDF